MESEEINDNFILDSSIVIKWFCEEEDTDKALMIREKFANGKIGISFPDLIIYEIANALRYNTKLTEKDIEDAVNSVIDLGAEIIVPTKELAKSAVTLARKHDITVYDSYYFALANELGFKLITADEILWEKVKDANSVILLSGLNLK